MRIRPRTNPVARGTKAPRTQDSVGISEQVNQHLLSVPTSLDARAIAAEMDKIDSDCQKLEKKKKALTPSEKYSEQAKYFSDSAAELKKYKREHPILSKIASFLPKLPWGSEFFKHTEITNRATANERTLLEALLKEPVTAEDISTPVYLILRNKLGTSNKTVGEISKKRTALNITDKDTLETVQAQLEKLENRRKSLQLAPSLKTLHEQATALRLALKDYKEAHPTISKKIQDLPDLPAGSDFFEHTKLAKKAATDQDALVNAALKTKDASPLAYSVICLELEDLKSKSGLELTYEIGPENLPRDEHDFLSRQTLHLDQLEKIHEKDREKAELIRRYRTLLTFKSILEKRLNTSTKKQLEQETNQATKAFKSILERPKFFGLAEARNQEDLNTKMRIARAKTDKKYFSSENDPEEEAEKKALETEYRDVLRLLSPPTSPKSTKEPSDTRSFDKMRQDNPGLSDSDVEKFEDL